MTYSESAALMTDADFRGRIKVACIRFAGSIQLEAPGTEGHVPRYRWAGDCFRSPESAALQVQPVVVMDPAVQSAGAAIDDGALQGAVEAAVKNFM